MMTRELIGGIATIAIGAAYFLMALRIRASALADTVGPAGFPKTLAIAMIVLGLILCAQALLAGRAKRVAEPAPGAGDAPIGDMADEDRPQGVRSVARAGGMLLLGIGYLLIVRFLGYIPSIALLMIAATLYLGTPFSWRVPAIGVAGALVYWLVFVWLLGIPLPAGRLVELF